MFAIARSRWTSTATVGVASTSRQNGSVMQLRGSFQAQLSTSCAASNRRLPLRLMRSRLASAAQPSASTGGPSELPPRLERSLLLKSVSRLTSQKPVGLLREGGGAD